MTPAESSERDEIALRFAVAMVPCALDASDFDTKPEDLPTDLLHNFTSPIVPWAYHYADLFIEERKRQRGAS